MSYTKFPTQFDKLNRLSATSKQVELSYELCQAGLDWGQTIFSPQLFLSTSVSSVIAFTRPTLSQLWSSKIRRTTFLNFMKFTVLLILRL